MATTNGKRADGTHWQSDKQECVRGHDLRPVIDGQPNPNVRRHPSTGTRQCIACARLRSRLMMNLTTAVRWEDEHLKTCATCSKARTCKHRRELLTIINARKQALTDNGFDSHWLDA